MKTTFLPLSTVDLDKKHSEKSLFNDHTCDCKVYFNQNPPPIDESEHKVFITPGAPNANSQLAIDKPVSNDKQSTKDGAAVVTLKTEPSVAVYVCEICEKQFASPSQLTSHRWNHTKPFACEFCNQRFSSKGTLIIHRRSHTGEKPFPCPQCNQRFTTRGNLLRSGHKLNSSLLVFTNLDHY